MITVAPSSLLDTKGQVLTQALKAVYSSGAFGNKDLPKLFNLSSSYFPTKVTRENFDTVANFLPRTADSFMERLQKVCRLTNEELNEPAPQASN